MRISILTLFPELFPGPLGVSVIGRALEKSIFSLNITNIRDFGKGAYKSVDDTPYGGGVGMVLRPDVVYDAFQEAYKFHDNDPKTLVIMTSPRGVPLKQQVLSNLSHIHDMIIICGRYEGIDQRLLEYFKKEHTFMEISIGDYVLTGGEMAAYVIIDGCVRLLQGTLKHLETIEEETFSKNMLEHAQYTKPSVWMDMSVPDVLISGHHARIQAWRQEESLNLTKKNRPDLLIHLTKER